MLRVMPETGGRGAGEGRHNPKGAVDAAEARYRWSYLPGEPDALKGACPVREGVVGNVPRGNALAAYFTLFVKKTPKGLQNAERYMNLARWAKQRDITHE